jgi:hypothetical protein
LENALPAKMATISKKILLFVLSAIKAILSWMEFAKPAKPHIVINALLMIKLVKLALDHGF